MKLPRLKVRTLLIVVAFLALLLEVVGLGQRSRRYATKARDAAEAEQSNLETASNIKLAMSQYREEADRVQSKDPAKAAGLRSKAERLFENIPFFEEQAARASRARVAYERALTHPWEAEPPDATRLNTTPPLK